MNENLVARLQAWKESVVLPRWVIDDVKELVSELTQAQADMEALRNLTSDLEWFHWPGTSGRMCVLCHYDEGLGHAPSCKFSALPEHLRGASR